MSKRLVLALALAVAVAVAAACHHDAPPPAAPADVPPLPPASGTPIGYLLDEATALHLDDAQLGKLQDIDRGLAAALDEIDTQLRASNKPAASDPSQQPMRRGGRHGGGGGGGGGHRGRGGGSGSGGATSSANSADIGRLSEARAADVRDAIHRAFALLDDTQRAAATKLLDDHGVDVDAGRGASPNDGSDDSDGSGEP